MFEAKCWQAEIDPQNCLSFALEVALLEDEPSESSVTSEE